MGNVATRKRPGCHHTARSDENEEEEDGPARKRLGLQKIIQKMNIRSKHHKLAFKSRLQKLKNCRPHLKRRTYKVEEADPRPPLPRFIVDDYDNYEKPETANRKEFAIPWFEHLFLPEFPTRSVINEKSFILERQLGRGSFGVVYCASAIHDSERKFAIKMQEKREIISKRAVLQVKREASIQRLLPAHPFIARTYSTWQTRTHLYSLLQYPTGSTGDLFSIWRQRGSLSEAAIRLIGAELASAIDFLHRNDVIYRDVKLENVVLDQWGHALLIDFGLAKKLKPGCSTGTICGTLQYMSPDVASGHTYSHYVDWWSLGVLLHILLTGIYPYPNSEATHHANLKFIDYSTPIGCSREFANLMDRMLAVSQTHRLCSFTVLHAHPFFRSINFSKLEQKDYTPASEIGNAEYDTYQQNDETLDDALFKENYDFDRFDYFNDRF
ncbi:Protein CBG16493 [Caenorhabditis briggsae]|uniref:Protein CBG16493 n=1 Tax=Caenorhabditis briggsae TaxID=6238 RepID=A8XPC2_CAEBR|nr:Protein CBG16493 [Caenorhabditis briggsae]CAP34443.2 Protein CBG16493 [Caenorhabditis briggsae]